MFTHIFGFENKMKAAMNDSTDKKKKKIKKISTVTTVEKKKSGTVPQLLPSFLVYLLALRT